MRITLEDAGPTCRYAKILNQKIKFKMAAILDFCTYSKCHSTTFISMHFMSVARYTISMRVAAGGPILFCVELRTIQLYMNCMNCN